MLSAAASEPGPVALQLLPNVVPADYGVRVVRIILQVEVKVLPVGVLEALPVSALQGRIVPGVKDPEPAVPLRLFSTLPVPVIIRPAHTLHRGPPSLIFAPPIGCR